MSTMANMYQVKRNMKGEEYANLGRFHASSLRRQMETEFQEDLGFCIRLYRNPDKPTPLLIFFRRGDIDKFIKGFDNLGKSKVVYVNLFKKRNEWIMKISPVVKGGETKVNIKGINEHNISYNLYLEECEYYEEEPLSYDEWLKQEEYEQEAIDRMLMTDAERYGEED